MPAIALAGVTKSFAPANGTEARHTALEDITLSVAEHRIVALVGPNGCGKSTLLHLVAGLDWPSGGSISIHGEPLQGLNRRATYMFQQDGLLPWKTALDNVVLGLTFRGWDRRQAAELGRQWLARVGLERFAGHFPYQLSGGMRKRIAIAQSWIVDPDIVLMDEPFSALDAQTRQLTEDELLGLWAASPKTVLLVTHDLAEAIALSDEVVLLSAGPASRVVGVYPVDLTRPRRLDELRLQPCFNHLYQAIWSDLRTEVMKSHERTGHLA
jgi:NitT/TauT family transport system ATP-binding protein